MNRVAAVVGYLTLGLIAYDIGRMVAIGVSNRRYWRRQKCFAHEK